MQVTLDMSCRAYYCNDGMIRSRTDKALYQPIKLSGIRLTYEVLQLNSLISVASWCSVLFIHAALNNVLFWSAKRQSAVDGQCVELLFWVFF